MPAQPAAVGSSRLSSPWRGAGRAAGQVEPSRSGHTLPLPQCGASARGASEEAKHRCAEIRRRHSVAVDSRRTGPSLQRGELRPRRVGTILKGYFAQRGCRPFEATRSPTSTAATYEQARIGAREEFAVRDVKDASGDRRDSRRGGRASYPAIRAVSRYRARCPALHEEPEQGQAFGRTEIRRSAPRPSSSTVRAGRGSLQRTVDDDGLESMRGSRSARRPDRARGSARSAGRRARWRRGMRRVDRRRRVRSSTVVVLGAGARRRPIRRTPPRAPIRGRSAGSGCRGR